MTSHHPPETHRALAMRAAVQGGVSLNRFVSARLARDDTLPISDLRCPIDNRVSAGRYSAAVTQTGSKLF